MLVRDYEAKAVWCYKFTLGLGGMEFEEKGGEHAAQEFVVHSLKVLVV